jgi:hypothetical protein
VSPSMSPYSSTLANKKIMFELENLTNLNDSFVSVRIAFSC